jgi:hypothetical protein
MTYLSEDPTLLVVGLLLVAGAFGIALRVTQQGKYLLRALVVLALAAAVVVMELLWVTDNERIEQVVYELRQAVLNSDVEGVLAHLTPEVQFSRDNTAIFGDATRNLIRANLANAQFEFIRVGHLQASAGQQTRRGTAQFQVVAKGSLQMPVATASIPPTSSVWSLGFQETGPGVWKVSRITPVEIPPGALVMPNGSPAPRGSRLGYTGRTGATRTIGRGIARLRRVDPPRIESDNPADPPDELLRR